MMTTTKQAKQAIREHIKDYCKENYPTAAELIDQLDALKYGNDIYGVGRYRLAQRFVQGGCLLCYNSETEKWLLENELTTQAHIDKADRGLKGVMSTFDYYVHLIAREMQTLERWYDAE